MTTNSRSVAVPTTGADTEATGTVEVDGLVGFLHSLIVRHDATTPAGTRVIVREKNAPARTFLDVTASTGGVAENNEYPVRQVTTETDGTLIDVDTTDNLISPTEFMLTGDTIEVVVSDCDALDPAVIVTIQVRENYP